MPNDTMANAISERREAVHPVTRLLLYRIYHIPSLIANTTSRFPTIIFHSSLNTDIVPGYISCSYSFCEQHGWYRIAKSEGAYSSNSCLISAKRFYNNMPPEYQRIQFFGVYTLRKFINISAASLMHAWTKIRETWDETNNVSYLEIYQNADSANMWLISIEDALSPEGNIQSWKTIPPVLTQETINGVTVLALSELPANNPA